MDDGAVPAREQNFFDVACIRGEFLVFSRGRRERWKDRGKERLEGFKEDGERIEERGN